MKTKTIKIIKDGEELEFQNIKEAYDWLACGLDNTLMEATRVFGSVWDFLGSEEALTEQEILHNDIEDRLNSLVKLLGKMADKYDPVYEKEREVAK